MLKMYLSVLLYVICVYIVSTPTEHLKKHLNKQFIKNTKNTIPMSSFYGSVVLLMKDG